LDNSTQKANKNQSIDSSNASDDKASKIDNINDRTCVDAQFLNFMISIGFTEKDIRTISQYDFVGSNENKSDVDLKKSCGCCVKINKDDNCIEVQLCDEHLKNMASFYVPESEEVIESVATDESLDCTDKVKTENVPVVDANVDKDDSGMSLYYDKIGLCGVGLEDVRLEDIDHWAN
jgi:hypothetical protein